MDITYLNIVDFIETLYSLSKSKIQYRILNVIGPGGGWPEVELIGTKKNLIEWTKKHGYELMENDLN